MGLKLGNKVTLERLADPASLANKVLLEKTVLTGKKVVMDRLGPLDLLVFLDPEVDQA